VDTELPPAVALSDSEANPTAPAVGSHLLVWDDTAAVWRRGRQTQVNSPGQVGASGILASAPYLHSTTNDTFFTAASATIDTQNPARVPMMAIGVVNGGFIDRKVSFTGSQGNLWNGVLTGTGGFSSVIDLRQPLYCVVFGTVSGATDLTMQISQDNVNYYDTTVIISAIGAATIYQKFTVEARFMRLRSSANVTAALTLAAKSGG
jgi:hypothetical protein